MPAGGAQVTGMRRDLLDSYVARLRQEASTHYSINVEVPYMVGRKRYAAGLPWSNAHRLTYRAQRLARLGYADAAHGRAIRPDAEAWSCLNGKISQGLKEWGGSESPTCTEAI